MNLAMKRLLFTLFSVALCLASVAKDQSKYIVHSSKLLLGYNSEKRAVLSSTSQAHTFRISPQGDGTVVVALDGAQTLYLSLGTSDNWSTFFLADSTDARARYTLTQSGMYTLLRNKKTNGYLGTDETRAGCNVYSDKDGSSLLHKWILSDTPEVEIPVDTLSYPVCVNVPRQNVEGWGVSLCWWANMCGKWSDKKIDEIVKWLVSPTGLNYNVFRYNIGGGDDPNWTHCTEHHMGSGKGLRAEMEGFQDERGGEFHWDRDEAQRKIMLKIKEKRPDAIFEAFSNSAPWWMTVSGCVGGNKDAAKDNLDPAYYEDFAHYLVEVCKHYKEEYGIEFRTLEPFNESTSNYWPCSGSQEGCHFDAKSQVAFLRVLTPILQESGLSTVISASDESLVSQSLSAWNTYESMGGLDMLQQWNTHTYGASNIARSQIGSLARAAGKTMWMSETGAAGQGISGNLAMSQRLFDDVRYIAPVSWVDWQYIEENNDQWCLVKGSFSNATYSRVKNYYVRAQVSRFIKQGYTVVPSLCEQSLAAVNPAGDTLVVVMLNNDVANVHRISLPMTKVNGTILSYRTSNNENLSQVRTNFTLLSDSVIQVNMPNMSITTLLIPITPLPEERPVLVDGDTYMIVPQANVNVAVSAADGAVKLAKADAEDPTQLWVLTKRKNGTWQLRTESGLSALYSNDYALKATKSVAGNIYYDLEQIDDIHYRIMLPNDSQGRCWDLQGQNLSIGTTVGAYVAGKSASAHGRQWSLVRVKGQISKEEDGIQAVGTEGQRPVTIYSPSGTQLKQMQRGVNIVSRAGGDSIKVFHN